MIGAKLAYISIMETNNIKKEWAETHDRLSRQTEQEAVAAWKRVIGGKLAKFRAERPDRVIEINRKAGRKVL